MFSKIDPRIHEQVTTIARSHLDSLIRSLEGFGIVPSVKPSLLRAFKGTNHRIAPNSKIFSSYEFEINNARDSVIRWMHMERIIKVNRILLRVTTRLNRTGYSEKLTRDKQERLRTTKITPRYVGSPGSITSQKTKKKKQIKLNITQIEHISHRSTDITQIKTSKEKKDLTAMNENAL